MRIAVFVNDQHHSCTIQEATMVEVYRPASNDWVVESSISVPLNLATSLPALRNYLSFLLDRLEECRIIVASKLIGLSFNIFDKEGYHIWEFEGQPSSFLPIIHEKEVIAKYELNASDDPYGYITNLGDDVYEINVKQLLYDDHTKTSKKLLMPFLNHKTFKELRITFSHIPPWLDSHLDKIGYERTLTKHTIDEHQLTITKKNNKGPQNLL